MRIRQVNAVIRSAIRGISVFGIARRLSGAGVEVGPKMADN
jgi:hypothetical protein